MHFARAGSSATGSRARRGRRGARRRPSPRPQSQRARRSRRRRRAGGRGGSANRVDRAHSGKGWPGGNGALCSGQESPASSCLAPPREGPARPSCRPASSWRLGTGSPRRASHRRQGGEPQIRARTLSGVPEWFSPPSGARYHCPFAPLIDTPPPSSCASNTAGLRVAIRFTTR
jgi:hypothetical protein